MKQTTWKTTSDGILETPKFLKRGTHVTVKPTPPEETEIEGNYGKRTVYIIDTTEFGLIYVAPLQVVKIAKALAIRNYEGNVGVDL